MSFTQLKFLIQVFTADVEKKRLKIILNNVFTEKKWMILNGTEKYEILPWNINARNIIRFLLFFSLVGSTHWILISQRTSEKVKLHVLIHVLCKMLWAYFMRNTVPSGVRYSREEWKYMKFNHKNTENSTSFFPPYLAVIHAALFRLFRDNFYISQPNIEIFVTHAHT